MGFSPAGGNISGADDVAFSNPTNGQLMGYNSSTALWTNVTRATDAQVRDRSTHTGTQAISSVTNLQTSLDAKADSATSAIVVQWTGSSWPTVSTSTSRVRHFYSQSDVNATPPTGYNVHDLWFAHPEAS